MSLQDLGNLGELLAAIATLITLIYLAIQIRENTKIARSQSVRELNTTKDFLLPIAENEDLARLVSRGWRNFESLSNDEKGRFHSYAHSMFIQIESVWRMHNAGLMEEDSFRGWQNAMFAIINTTGGGQWWKYGKSMFSPGFVEAVERDFESFGRDVPSIDKMLPWFLDEGDT